MPYKCYLQLGAVVVGPHRKIDLVCTWLPHFIGLCVGGQSDLLMYINVLLVGLEIYDDDDDDIL